MTTDHTVGLGGGGAMYSPAISPHDPRLLFVACDMGGLYRSHSSAPTPAGASWELVDTREVEMSHTIDRSTPPNRWLPPTRLAFHPTQAHTVFATSRVRGLRVSMDHGRRWIGIPTGQSSSGQAWLNATLTALAVDGAGRLFVGTENGVHYHDPPWTGGNWQACAGISAGEVIAFVFLTDPSTGQALRFLAVRGTRMGAHGGVFRSHDGGATWVSASGALPSTWQLPSGLWRRIDSFAGGASATATPQVVLYAAVPARDKGNSTYEGGVWRSDDLGATWVQAMGNGIDQRLAPVVAQYMCLGVSSGAPHTVFASGWPRDGVTGSFAVYKSVDRGQNWSHALTRPLDAHPPATSVAGGWLDWDRAGFGGPPLALTASGASAMCANLGQVYLTDDGGASWRSVYTRYGGATAPAARQPWDTTGLDVTTVWGYRIDPADTARHYIASTDIGLARSLDSGQTWRYDYDRNWPWGQWSSNFYELAFDPAAPTHLWAATSDQHDIPMEKELKAAPGGGGVVLSTDRGLTWAPKNAGLPSKPAVSIVLDPTSPAANRRLWVSMFGSGVWTTADGGASWAKTADPNPNNSNVYRLHRHDDGSLFCAVTAKWDAPTTSFLFESGLYRSGDGGQTWTAITRAPHSATPLSLKYVRDYAVSPTNSNLIYLCTGGVAGLDGAVYRTADGGQTWTAVLTAANLPATYNPYLHAFGAFFDPRDQSGQTVYVTTSTHGTWLTRDGVGPWEEVRGLPFLSTHRITFDAQNRGVVYYTTHGAGVWSPADVYLRDFVGDIGDAHAGMISMSPDVIVRTSPVANPTAAFGQGSGTENDDMLSNDVEYGQDNYIYVRLLNRGRPAAGETKVQVYWAEAGTLITPNNWHLIGTATLPDVPAGNTLVVSDGVTWAAADIPTVGHYCFVAVAATDRDPGPPLNAFSDWDAYMRFIRRQNNVTWRNFNVVDVVPAATKSIELPLVISGAPDEDLLMDFEILAEDFPRGGKLWLELDSDFIRAVGLGAADLRAVEGNGAGARARGRRRKRRLPVVGGKLKLERLELAAGSRNRVQLIVDAPKGPLRKAHDVIARQVFEGEEVGRITWRLRRARKRAPVTREKRPEKKAVAASRR
jgi:photosystem II stability/assembly factor-like uncharacterized protein